MAINQEKEKREGNLQVRLVVDVVSKVWLLFFQQYYLPSNSLDDDEKEN